jgi:KUP system potassium uptake protein
MTTWQRGRAIVTKARREAEGSLPAFTEELRGQDLARVPGTAVFLNRGKETAPLALRANVEHNQACRACRRIEVDELGYGDDGIIHLTARIGYMETPDVPAALALLEPEQTEGRLNLSQARYFLSKIELQRGKAPTMAGWRKRLFVATSYITADAAEHFGLPRERTVIMGAHVDVQVVA